MVAVDKNSDLANLKGRALRVQSWVQLQGQAADERSLLNVIINAPSYLGKAHDENVPALYINHHGKIFDSKVDFRDQVGKEDIPISILFIFGFYAKSQ